MYTHNIKAHQRDCIGLDDSGGRYHGVIGYVRQQVAEDDERQADENDAWQVAVRVLHLTGYIVYIVPEWVKSKKNEDKYVKENKAITWM